MRKLDWEIATITVTLHLDEPTGLGPRIYRELTLSRKAYEDGAFDRADFADEVTEMFASCVKRAAEPE